MRKFAKMITIILSLIFISNMTISTMAAFEDENDEDFILNSEYRTKYYVDRDELDALEELMYNYYDSIRGKNPDALLEYVGNSVFDALSVKFLGARITLIVSGLRELLDDVSSKQYESLCQYAWDGYSAARKARNGFLSSEQVFNTTVYEAEVEFLVYKTWNNYNQEFIFGGGHIKRVRVNGGWISTSSPMKLKELEELLKQHEAEI